MIYLQDLSEEVVSLPITTGAVKKSVIYSIFIPQLNDKSLMSITAEFEATDPYQYNVMIGSNIVLTNSKTGTEGILVDEANAWNITPAMHHGVVVKARQMQYQGASNSYYLNLCAWAMAESAKPNDALKIEQNYGHLDVVILQI